MKTVESNLSIHLPLDDIEPSRARPPARFMCFAARGAPESGPGEPQIVPDDRFGSCMSFDGTAVHEEPLTPGQAALLSEGSFTVCAWVNIAEFTQGPHCVIGASSAGGNDFTLLGIGADAKLSAGFDGAAKRGTARLQASAWYHVASCFDRPRQKQSMFVNGRLDGEIDWNEPFPGLDRLLIGGRSGGCVTGKIAHVRMYNEALPGEGIAAVMSADQSARAAFRLSYPIDFRLADAAGGGVLYISDDTKPRQCRLELTNSSDRAIAIGAAGGIPDGSNYHFALTFKPNTFEPQEVGSAIGAPVLPDGWISGSSDDMATGMTSVYFLYTGPGRKLSAGGRLEFTLEYASANGNGGARGTTVLLQYQHIAYCDDTTPLKGTRIKSVDIANRLGNEKVPLHVSFCGPNTVLNVEHPGARPFSNTLNLCVTNISRENAVCFRTTEIDCGKNTRFSILFEQVENREWDLADAHQLSAITVLARQRSFKPEDVFTVPDGLHAALEREHVSQPVLSVLDALLDGPQKVIRYTGADFLRELKKRISGDPAFAKTAPEKIDDEAGLCLEYANGSLKSCPVIIDKEGDRPAFEILPAADLGPGEYIDIFLTNIHTGKASGFATIYLKYQNVPGYWDGKFALPVEKSPIVQDACKNVGIGILPPEASPYRLTVGGALKIDAASVTGIGTDGPESGEEWRSVLDMCGCSNAALSVRALDPQGDAAIDARIAVHTEGRRGAPPGMMVGTETAHSLSFYTDKTPRLTVTPGGNVGIGTTDPKTALDVRGIVRAERFQFADGGVLDIVKVESGEINIPNDDMCHILKPDEKQPWDTYELSIRFQEACFTRAPKVIPFVTRQLPGSGPRCNIETKAEDVTIEGFRLHVHKSHEAALPEATIVWLAIGT